MSRPALAAAAVLAALVAAPAPARAEPPSDGELVLLGLALALPTYGVGVISHEGTHVIAAELVGAETIDFRPWPGRDRLTGAFQMGLTRVRGLDGDGERIWFFLAPKLTDLVLLGGYVALYESDAYPDGSYGQLVVTVLATGFWIDFAKDTLAFSRHNDLVKAGRLMGLDREWKRIPLRLGFAAASAGLGYLVWRGHDRLFASNDAPGASGAPLVLPLASGSF